MKLTIKLTDNEHEVERDINYDPDINEVDEIIYDMANTLRKLDKFEKIKI